MISERARKTEYMRHWRWRSKNREKIKNYNKQYSDAHREHINARQKQYRIENAVELRKRRRAQRERDKLEALTNYAQNGLVECACCGETTTEFLTLDHVDDDGKEHRKIAGNGNAFYRWLKTRGYPRNPPLQILCFNCNYGKRFCHGVCPHKLRLSTNDEDKNMEHFLEEHKT